MEVPEMLLVLPSFQVLMMFLPGAQISTTSPKF